MKKSRSDFDKLVLASGTAGGRSQEIKRKMAVPTLTNWDWPFFLKTPKP
jgi:hypothetical protein